MGSFCEFLLIFVSEFDKIKIHDKKENK